MKVIFLTESGKNIGLGHLTRCIAIADAFETRKINTFFIINGQNNIKNVMGKKKYKILNWLKNEKKVFKLLKDYDSIVIDSYLASKSFYIKLSKLKKLCIYIDDNKRISYPKGIVLNGNIYARDLNYPKNKNIKYLLGLKYLPIRKEFLDEHGFVVNKKVKQILITLGGSDVRNMSYKLGRLLKNEFPNINIFIILGSNFKYLNKYKDQIKKEFNLYIDPDVKKLKKIMLNSDIAISSGGQTIYELMHIGLPSVSLLLAHNQLDNIKILKELKLSYYVGKWNDKYLNKKIIKTIKFIMKYRVRKKINKKYKTILNKNDFNNKIFTFLD
jgi:UDP-2,4-diacetamido-2,4,6-trideoxy-beta-L-altropyranose hydrolase